MTFAFKTFQFASHTKMPQTKIDNSNLKYYNLLEVQKDASMEDIRKAYRIKAVKLHPDKGGTQEQFQELQSAYDVLSDPAKRNIYNAFGENGLKNINNTNIPKEGAYPFNLLTVQNRMTNTKRKAQSVQLTLNAKLEDIYTGAKKTITFQRNSICTTCNGSGGTLVKCHGCNGTGYAYFIQGICQQSTICKDCMGHGHTIKEKCGRCTGQKVIVENKQVEIWVDKGSPNDKTFVLSLEGHQYPGHEPGDVIIKLQVEIHPIFTRNGDNLFCTANINLLQALTGFEFILEHLDKKKYLVRSKAEEIILPGMVKPIKEKGMPIFGNASKYGNLMIGFNIIFPQKIDTTQEKLLKQAFSCYIQKRNILKVDETCIL